MKNENGLWRVTFSYEVPGEYTSNRDKNIYTVVAKSEKEAYAKAHGDFSQTRSYQDLNLSIENRVLTTITKIKSKKIKLLELTLKEDSDKFQVRAKISDDGLSLEYIVSEDSHK